MWFDEMSAARAMLKLSRSSNDADLHQFITSSLSSSSSASAASNTNTTSTSRVTAVTVVFSVASAFLYLLVMYDINHFAAMALGYCPQCINSCRLHKCCTFHCESPFTEFCSTTHHCSYAKSVKTMQNYFDKQVLGLLALAVDNDICWISVQQPSNCVFGTE